MANKNKPLTQEQIIEATEIVRKMIKNRILGIVLLLAMACAPNRFETIFSMQAPQGCDEVSSFGGIIEDVKVTVKATRYRDCFGYDEVLVMEWDKFNITSIRVTIKMLLDAYFRKINRKEKVVQYEQYNDKFYIIYELIPR